MKIKKLVIVLGIIGTISTPAIIIGVIQPWNRKEFLEFTPTEMLSCPNHTAWLLAEAKIKGDKLDDSIVIELTTNVTIESEYKTWITDDETRLIEIFLYPNTSHLDKIIGVELIVNSSISSVSGSASITVIDWTYSISQEILDMQDKFIQYLAENETAFQINESVTWEPIFNSVQILIVEHYLFKSQFWEMELSRHVMIAPGDWVKIYLRPRNAVSPVWAGEIESWSTNNNSIIEIEPPEEIYR